MKKVLIIAVLLSTLVLPLSARSKPPAAPLLRRGTLIQMQKQMIEDMISILERCNGSAVRASAALNRYYFRNNVRIMKMQKEMLKQQQILQRDPAKAQAFMRAYMPLLQRSMYLGRLMQKYMNDPAFLAAMTKMKLHMNMGGK